jgi:aminopeptidase N
MTFLFLTILLFIALGFGSSLRARQATDGYIRQTGFDVLHYNLNLSVSDTDNVVYGKAIVTVHRRDLHDSTLTLDFKIFSETALGSPRTEGSLAHEIAHQWFGDSVTEAEWHHLWLSEGLATYFEALFYEHSNGCGSRDIR